MTLARPPVARGLGLTRHLIPTWNGRRVLVTGSMSKTRRERHGGGERLRFDRFAPVAASSELEGEQVGRAGVGGEVGVRGAGGGGVAVALRQFDALGAQ